MKGVFNEVPDHLLDWRRQTGADKFDEMWEGVLHMSPSPNREHQRLEWALETWLRVHWADPDGHEVYHQRNVSAVGEWPKNYRIPDLVLLLSNELHLDLDEYIDGPPAVVVEIRSPGDETDNKLPFYAELGVREVWVIDRDSKLVELHALSDGTYQLQSPITDGWLVSKITGVELKSAAGKLAIRLKSDGDTKSELP